jgi:ABC-type nickel/cobalt efflux system permease component RcnA
MEDSLMRRRILVALLIVLSVCAAQDIAAHPLGNFSISQYSAIAVDRNKIELRYLIDMAEIPTFQELQESAIVAQEGDASLPAYLARKADALRKTLLLEINGKRLELTPESQEIIFPPGAGGLPTMKIGILYTALLPVDSNASHYFIRYRDGNFAGRAGWKEVIATAKSGVEIVDSSVPATDRSSQLSNYPIDLMDSPPQDLEARVSFSIPAITAPLASARPADSRAPERQAGTARIQSDARLVRQPATKPESTERVENGSDLSLSSEPDESRSPIPDVVQFVDTGALPLQANKQTPPRNGFTELMATKQWGWGLVVTALAVAVGLGGVHALEPGHGKTLVAAYLVGSQGTMKHAFFLGLIVTATHTAGVYLLGAVTLYAAQYVMPEQLYPWLGVLSGLLITGVGLVLFARRYFGDADLISHHHHHHGDRAHAAHDHHHGDDLHHQHAHPHHGIKRDVSLRELMALGISGGIVPCPAALVVLLSAVSMQRISLGLLLILGFSVGLATVLIVTGLMMVYARRFMARFHGTGRVTTRWLPLTSAVFIGLFGLAMTWQALQTAGVL